MQAILLTADIACSSRVTGAAASRSIRCETAMTVGRLVARVSSEGANLVLLDLTTPGLDCLALVPQLRDSVSPSPIFIAFGPHVHEQHLAAAAQAGCDQVLARGQFYARAAELIEQFASDVGRDF